MEELIFLYVNQHKYKEAVLLAKEDYELQKVQQEKISTL